MLKYVRSFSTFSSDIVWLSGRPLNETIYSHKDKDEGKREFFEKCSESLPNSTTIVSIIARNKRAANAHIQVLLVVAWLGSIPRHIHAKSACVTTSSYTICLNSRMVSDTGMKGKIMTTTEKTVASIKRWLYQHKAFHPHLARVAIPKHAVSKEVLSHKSVTSIECWRWGFAALHVTMSSRHTHSACISRHWIRDQIYIVSKEKTYRLYKTF